MPDQDLPRAAWAYAHSRKERLLEETAPFLLVLRDDAPVAVMESDDLSVLLRAGRTAGPAYGADALALVVEGVPPARRRESAHRWPLAERRGPGDLAPP